MKQTVTFIPSNLDCGVTEPGQTTTGISQCAPATEFVDVTASIINDTSGDAANMKLSEARLNASYKSSLEAKHAERKGQTTEVERHVFVW